jgi:hypothetical protein
LKQTPGEHRVPPSAQVSRVFRFTPNGQTGSDFPDSVTKVIVLARRVNQFCINLQNNKT